MKPSYRPDLYLTLIHHPVVNKGGDTIASSVTNLDLHDIARASRTYGVRAFYVVTPLEDQKKLVERIVDHWVSGAGAAYNPMRREALELIRIARSAEAVYEDIRRRGGGIPKSVVTTAQSGGPTISCGELRGMLRSGGPYLLNFGTAWGLSKEFISGADYVLEPIKGNTDYNHLPVRSAVSIILDRLVGR
ncbi:hypothetical protein DENIS_0395 [Desulfonema ishimotonii]|uniref:tRNA (guanine-N(1)-)-methyltransferase C-terminal domain-containing protein n=1 Tax=Desulfonema ishimotonii TaxID=45657 RepID=A0A401FR65_9BACT|nr:RNA methyltransferase [Desulfonema ishimotonii]GBC59456.1 hypothetical protein DENIS_0395 [Desulfonema ishimotonii]